MLRSTRLRILAILAVGALSGLAPVQGDESSATMSQGEVLEIAVDAYVYAYPLVLMDVSRQVMTNVEAVTPRGKAPVNQFGHRRTFPDATFTDVVRPNADTLYSSLWFDVTREPLILSVPDSGGRYYLLPLMDLWTDVFASPGKRTSGTGPQTYAIVGPRWEGKMPKGVEPIRAPTATGWLIGRTQTNGKPDFEAVYKFQDALSAIPLSLWGKPYSVPKAATDPPPSKVPPPVEQVAKLDAATFFARFCELTRDNPPHANDYPILQRLRRIGIEPGKPLDLAKLPSPVQQALQKAVPAGQAKIKGYARRADPFVNGWLMIRNPVGTYGTDYLKRALIAYMALGANVIEDSIYPTAFALADGTPFDSSQKYVLHFAKEQLPPIRAFWSLSMYNGRQLFTDNPIDRYAIGDRDPLKFNGDGSLTLYIQRESPGPNRESNWLPTPAAGGFNMSLRLFWPRPEALDGTWKPPAVKRAE